MSDIKKTLSICAIGIVLFSSAVQGILPSTDYSRKQVAYLEEVSGRLFQESQGKLSLEEFQKKCMEQFSRDDKIVFRDKYRKLLDDDDWSYEVDYQLKRLEEKHVPGLTDKELEKNAEEKFPIYKRGQRVIIVYKKNPLVVTSLEGIFLKCENGIVHIAGRQIRLQDMTGIVDNEKEILKFLPEKSMEKREEYIAAVKKDVLDQRKAWRVKNQDRIKKELKHRMGGINEKNGYVSYRGDWYNMKELCRLVSEDVWKTSVKKLKADKLRQQKDAVKNMKLQVEVLAYMGEISPLGTRLSPEAELARRDAIRRKEKMMAELKQKKEEEARQARIREEAEKRRAIEEENRRRRQRRLDQIRNQKVENPDDFEQGFFTTKVLFGGMIIVFVAGILLLFAIRKKERGNDLSKFFQGKGKLQKDFWDAANADPDHFRYVAYLFPGLAEANDALSQMSYISLDSTGNLHCNKDIRFGVYPHQKGAVAFVGGQKLNYALWKEASAVWPELEGAQYFKVSPEPVVLVEIPDLSILNGENNLAIKDLGVQDITGEHGEIIRCYNFESDTRENAMAFLEKFSINEEGVVVHITFDNGNEKYGKDSKGIFKL